VNEMIELIWGMGLHRKGCIILEMVWAQ